VNYLIKVGFIGYGSMGSMIVQGFIRSGAISPEEMIISTKTRSKLDKIKSEFTKLNIANNNSEVAKSAKYVFICVKPLEVMNVVKEIRNFLTEESVIISIAGSVAMKYIENIADLKVIKLTPSLTSEVSEGVSLICHGQKVRIDEANYVESLLNNISVVKRIREEDFELAAELTSCAPGFFASILDEFVKSALRQNSGLCKEDVEDMVLHTFYGTAKVLIDKNMRFDDMIQRVATKGGITEEGVNIFSSCLPDTFDKMFGATLEKRKAVRKKIEDSL
jgi:pyrroline-5-carboxylate reductase